MKIPISEIKVDKSSPSMKRYRIDLGDLSDLKASISKHGLLNPLTLVKLEKQEGKYKYILVAGERRMRCCLLLGMIEVYVNIREGDLDLAKKEMELEENVCRKEISWPEKIEALNQLDILKREIHGDASTRPDGKDGGGGWGIKDTARISKQSPAAVSQDLKLARDMKKFPELAKKLQKLPKHAARKKIRQAEEEKALRKRMTSGELVVDSSLKLGSCVDLIKEVASDSIHMILTDPPFAVGEITSVASGSKTDKGFGGASYNTTETNVGTEKDMTDIYKVLIPELHRVLVPGGHFYIFFGHTWYCRLYKMLVKAGFKVYDMPIIWDKMRASMIPKDCNYMSSYEAIFYGYKYPTSRLLKYPTRNVVSIPMIPPQGRVHPLQKPHDLLKIFIENSTSPGETVLDCFAGSASTLKSAMMLNRKSTGFEIDKGNYLRAQESLAQTKKAQEAYRELMNDCDKVREQEGR